MEQGELLAAAEAEALLLPPGALAEPAGLPLAWGELLLLPLLQLLGAPLLLGCPEELAQAD